MPDPVLSRSTGALGSADMMTSVSAVGSALPPTTSVLLAVAVLAAGTYVLRLGGAALRARFAGSPGVDATVDTAAVILLVAVMATTGLTQDGGAAGVARPAAVVVACVLAWQRRPFVVVILAAAATAAGLRALGFA